MVSSNWYSVALVLVAADDASGAAQGRVRHRAQVRTPDAPPTRTQWLPSRRCHTATAGQASFLDKAKDWAADNQLIERLERRDRWLVSPTRRHDARQRLRVGPGYRVHLRQRRSSISRRHLDEGLQGRRRQGQVAAGLRRTPGALDRTIASRISRRRISSARACRRRGQRATSYDFDSTDIRARASSSRRRGCASAPNSAT